MKKRILALLFVALLVARCLPMTAGAAEISGRCGTDAYWLYDEDTTILTIGGTGETEDYTTAWNNNEPWKDFQDSITSVVISEGITRIGNGALGGEMVAHHYSNLKSISLPSTLKSIGSYAFAGSSIESVTLPADLETIEACAFYGTPINQITLPNTLKTLGWGAFGATELTTIHIPASVSSIGYNSYGIEQLPDFKIKTLESITVDSNSPYFCVEDYVLYDKNKTKLICYPINSPLTEIYLPDGLKELDAYAFYFCDSLRKIVVPASVTVLDGGGQYDSFPVSPDKYRTWMFLGDAPQWAEDSSYRCIYNFMTEGLISTRIYYPAEASGWTEFIQSYDLSYGGRNSIENPSMQIKTEFNAYYSGDDSGGDPGNSGNSGGNTGGNSGGNSGGNTGTVTPDGPDDEPDNSVPSIYAFTDVNPDGWYRDAINYVLENGLMSGTGDKTFEPNSTLTRAMLVQILYNLEDKPAAAGTGDFTDVSASAWYADAVAWAAANKVVAGNDNGAFAPEDAVTREQVAVILRNYAMYKGQGVAASGSLAGFTDGGKTSNWATDAMQWALGFGLFSGKENGILDPVGKSTRAEAAVVLMKFLTA